MIVLSWNETAATSLRLQDLNFILRLPSLPFRYSSFDDLSNANTVARGMKPAPVFHRVNLSKIIR
jgi:hypothetical protein